MTEIKDVIELLEIDINSLNIVIYENRMYTKLLNNICVDIWSIDRIHYCNNHNIYDKNIVKLIAKILKYLVAVQIPELKIVGIILNTSLSIGFIKNRWCYILGCTDRIA